MQIAMLGGRLHGRRGRQPAPRHGGLEAQGRRSARSTSGWSARMVEKGYDARVRRAHLQADRGLRRIRLPREPRRQLCAAGLCERAGSSATTPTPSWPRCSTASRWASTRRRNWCATRARTASTVRPVDVRRSELGLRRSSRPRGARPRLAGAPGPEPHQRLRAGVGAALAGRARRGSLRQRRRPGAPRRARCARSCSCWRSADALQPSTGHRHQAAWAVARRGHARHAAAASATRTHEAPAAAGRARRGRRHAGRLPQHRPVAAPPPAGAAARARWPRFKVQPAAVLRELSATAGWRAPAAWSRTASGPRRPRAWSS